jgi:hypothetical protein
MRPPSSKLDLIDLLPLKNDPPQPSSIHKFIGLAWGFPIAVHLSHRSEGTEGVFLYVATDHEGGGGGGRLEGGTIRAPPDPKGAFLSSSPLRSQGLLP